MLISLSSLMRVPLTAERPTEGEHGLSMESLQLGRHSSAVDSGEFICYFTTSLTSIIAGILCYQQFPSMAASSTATLLKACLIRPYSMASSPACWIKWPHFPNPIPSSSWTTAEYTKTLRRSTSLHHGSYILQFTLKSHIHMVFVSVVCDMNFCPPTRPTTTQLNSPFRR